MMRLRLLSRSVQTTGRYIMASTMAPLPSKWMPQARHFSEQKEAPEGLDEDTHDDFKPQPKPIESYEEIEKVFQKDIESSQVFLYMKGNPQAPNCGFSSRVCQIFQVLDIKFESRNILENDVVRQGIKKFSAWPTVPQIYVNQEFVGGCDTLMEMLEGGDLKAFLDENKVPYRMPKEWMEQPEEENKE